MRDLLVTGIVFGVLPFIFRRPWIGILLWCWLSYMNPHRQTWGFAYDMPFAMITAVVTITAFLFSREKKEMPWTRETVLLLLFVGWMLVTTFFAFYQDPAWEQWNKVWKIQLMVFLTAMMIRERRHLHWMIWVIALSLGYYGVKGGIFTIVHGGQFRVQGPSGTFFEGNNEMALVLAMLFFYGTSWTHFVALAGAGVAASGTARATACASCAATPMPPPWRRSCSDEGAPGGPRSLALMVGDHPLDIETGKRLGLHTAGVASGRIPLQDLKACAPDWVAENCALLLKTLDAQRLLPRKTAHDRRLT